MYGIPKHHVAAGSFIVAKKEKQILQAFLGTCVGVALYDDTAGIGGLFHILLPEPVCSDSSLFPEKYASTGIPHFIKALFQAGASRENLKAVIAGGALVGPLEERDLSLDIGGRSVDIVHQQLSREKIPVEKSETGGFFTCSLSLNLENGDIQIEPAGYDRYTETQEVSIPTQEEISHAMEKLKPIPQVALKILRMIGHDDYDIQEISDEVRKDQVISAKTLQLCNSAMFSIKRKIETLDHALLLIGQDQLVKLVISASVRKLFDSNNRGYSLCKGGLYYHALGTAIVAEKLAQITGRVLPGLAYTAGLLHDIGKTVLDQYVSTSYPLFYRNIAQDGQGSLETEKKILSVDHTETGYNLAIKWGFPDSLASAICFHHTPDQDSKHQTLTHILYLADLLMGRFHAGLEFEHTVEKNLPEKLEKIGLTPSSIPELIDALPESLFSISSDTLFAEAGSS